jgi:molybdate transport system substrate-binding protein
MKHNRLFVSFLLAAFTVCCGSALHAQTQLTLLSPNPITEPLDKIVANFQAKTGIQVKITYGTGVSTKKTVADGGALDVTLLFAPFPEALQTGNIVKGSATVVAQLRLGFGVKKGAPKPDLSTAASVKKALLDAKSISAIDPAQGSAGGVAQAALEKLGISDAVKDKVHLLRNAGMVQDAVAKGESDIALGPYYSEMRNPGVDAAPLPPDASMPVEITGFLSTSVKDTKAAKSLLDYLKGPEAAPIWSEDKVFPVK